tara:strand:+ start:9003 stop:10679 length:1677 start_codon:yes stop_codon:yes gene_type:complete
MEDDVVPTPCPSAFGKYWNEDNNSSICNSKKDSNNLVCYEKRSGSDGPVCNPVTPSSELCNGENAICSVGDDEPSKPKPNQPVDPSNIISCPSAFGKDWNLDSYNICNNDKNKDDNVCYQNVGMFSYGGVYQEDKSYPQMLLSKDLTTNKNVCNPVTPSSEFCTGDQSICSMKGVPTPTGGDNNKGVVGLPRSAEINFRNSTESDIFAFSITAGNHTVDAIPTTYKAEICNNDDVCTPAPQASPCGASTYYYRIPRNNYLNIKNIDNEKTRFTAANFVISKATPPCNNFDYAGMTNYEFSIDESGLWPDISGVTGVNSFGNFSLEGTECIGDIKEMRKCTAPPSGDANDFMDNDNGINKYTRKKMDDELSNKIVTSLGPQIIPSQSKDIACGRGSNNPSNKCMLCATGKDYLQKGQGLDTFNNFKDFQERWGCYLWWNDPDNEAVTKWNKVFENCNDLYTWPYDEVQLKNYPTPIGDDYKNITDYLPGIKECMANPSASCPQFWNSDLMKCSTKHSSECPDKPGTPYLILNDKSPLAHCQLKDINEPAKLGFTINSVL